MNFPLAVYSLYRRIVIRQVFPSSLKRRAEFSTGLVEPIVFQIFGGPCPINCHWCDDYRAAAAAARRPSPPERAINEDVRAQLERPRPNRGLWRSLTCHPLVNSASVWLRVDDSACRFFVLAFIHADIP